MKNYIILPCKKELAICICCPVFLIDFRSILSVILRFFMVIAMLELAVLFEIAKLIN
jgi:hypothetical protein